MNWEVLSVKGIDSDPIKISARAAMFNLTHQKSITNPLAVTTVRVMYLGLVLVLRVL